MAGNQTPDPLANLRDIHQPEAISWWPLAPGWWLLLIFILVILGLGIWLYKRHRRNRFRRQATSLLQVSYLQWQQNADNQAYLISANQLLKQCLMQQGLRRETASCSGKHWLRLMQQAAPGVQCSNYAVWLENQYQPDAEDNLAIADIHQELLVWIRQHRAELIRDVATAGEESQTETARVSAPVTDSDVTVKPIVQPSGQKSAREVNHA